MLTIITFFMLSTGMILMMACFVIQVFLWILNIYIKIRDTIEEKRLHTDFPSAWTVK